MESLKIKYLQCIKHLHRKICFRFLTFEFVFRNLWLALLSQLICYI